MADDLQDITVTRGKTASIVIGDGSKLPDNTAMVLDLTGKRDGVITIGRFKKTICLVDGHRELLMELCLRIVRRFQAYAADFAGTGGIQDIAEEGDGTVVPDGIGLEIGLPLHDRID